MSESERDALLNRIRDETRQAVIEGDADDCSSPDCIADAVYEIVRAALSPGPEPEIDIRTAGMDGMIRVQHADGTWCLHLSPGPEPVASYTPGGLRYPTVDELNTGVSDGTPMLRPEPVACSYCGGQGWYVTADALPDGEPDEPYQVQCGECRGTGTVAGPEPVAGLDVRRLAQAFERLHQLGWLLIPDGYTPRNARELFQAEYVALGEKP